ncbi:hypothetical protein [Sulfurimonas sp.]|uniref:hypothetical protein n=1 Tax=Sulfurimonas sp. TaxID=2022749 RepID=UPI0025E06155|nr:hypothetical protein [Sulfurimonas sp.]MDD5157249.1 hypothetical protein [Sulfurimonas sp.]
MLENSVWKQYNSENSFREMLVKYCKVDSLNLIEDDKELYGALKAKLTKKELRLFAMDSAGVDDLKMKEEFSCGDEELRQAKFKLYKKLKQDKVRSYLVASSGDE